jgi:hypothetical protein
VASKLMKHVSPSCAEFLSSHSGLGGTFDLTKAKEAAAKRKSGKITDPGPAVKAEAVAARPNPPSTELRRYYERSDLPIVIVQYV